MNEVEQILSGRSCPTCSLASIPTKGILTKTDKKINKKNKEGKTKKVRSSLPPLKMNTMLNKIEEDSTKKRLGCVPDAQKININFTQIDNAGPFRNTNLVPIITDISRYRIQHLVPSKVASPTESQALGITKYNKCPNIDMTYPSPRFGRMTGRRKNSNNIRMALEKMALDPDSENSEISIHKQAIIKEPIIEKRSITSLINAQYESD